MPKVFFQIEKFSPFKRFSAKTTRRYVKSLSIEELREEYVKLAEREHWFQEGYYRLENYVAALRTLVSKINDGEDPENLRKAR